MFILETAVKHDCRRLQEFLATLPAFTPFLRMLCHSALSSRKFWCSAFHQRTQAGATSDILYPQTMEESSAGARLCRPVNCSWQGPVLPWNFSISLSQDIDPHLCASVVNTEFCSI